MKYIYGEPLIEMELESEQMKSHNDTFITTFFNTRKIV